MLRVESLAFSSTISSKRLRRAEFERRTHWFKGHLYLKVWERLLSCHLVVSYPFLSPLSTGKSVDLATGSVPFFPFDIIPKLEKKQNSAALIILQEPYCTMLFIFKRVLEGNTKTEKLMCFKNYLVYSSYVRTDTFCI